MKKVSVVALGVLVVFAAASCGGPMILTNAVGDFQAQKYHEVPWLWGNVVSHGIIGVVTGVTWFIDSLVNIYFFFIKDAQPIGDGKGTSSDRKSATPGKK
jgi:hypothetical protein